jgi:hypothetical protein
MREPGSKVLQEIRAFVEFPSGETVNALIIFNYKVKIFFISLFFLWIHLECSGKT